MKAININGEIQVFNNLPNSWKNYLNFSVATEELLKQEGFYDVIIPSYDVSTHKLGPIYFNETKQYFTYNVIEKTQSEIEYEDTLKNWHHLQYSKRIIVPYELITQYTHIGLHMIISGLPILREGNNIYLYMNDILPEHQSLLEELKDVITIENKPFL